MLHPVSRKQAEEYKKEIMFHRKEKQNKIAEELRRVKYNGPEEGCSNHEADKNGGSSLML